MDTAIDVLIDLHALRLTSTQYLSNTFKPKSTHRKTHNGFEMLQSVIDASPTLLGEE